jgi:hypothetical protein
MLLGQERMVTLGTRDVMIEDKVLGEVAFGKGRKVHLSGVANLYFGRNSRPLLETTTKTCHIL